VRYDFNNPIPAHLRIMRGSDDVGKFCRWFDSETSQAEILVRDGKGLFIIENDELKTEIILARLEQRP